ncbi:MAG: hypothetical protein P8P49_05610 [Opitutales bacterium]|nr:hypothetical protein [Opitutales bacterium]
MFNHFHNEGSPQLLTKYPRAFTLKIFTLSSSQLLCLQKTNFLRHFVLPHTGVVSGTSSTFAGKNSIYVKSGSRDNFVLQGVPDSLSKSRPTHKHSHHPSNLARGFSGGWGILNAQEWRFVDNPDLYESVVLRPSALGRILPLRSYIHPKIYGILSSFGSLVIPMIYRVIYLRDYLLRRTLVLTGLRLNPDQHKDQSGLTVREWCVAKCELCDSSANFVTKVFCKIRNLFPEAKHQYAHSNGKFSQVIKAKQMLKSFNLPILNL